MSLSTRPRLTSRMLCVGSPATVATTIDDLVQSDHERTTVRDHLGSGTA